MPKNINWETINLPAAGQFYKWGDTAGQEIIGTVTNYTEDGGTDFDGNPCPRIDIELAEPSESDEETLPAGTAITWQGNSPTRLANRLQQANPKPGDLIKIRHEGRFKTPKGTGKDISVQIARGAGKHQTTPPLDDEPPF